MYIYYKQRFYTLVIIKKKQKSVYKLNNEGVV